MVNLNTNLVSASSQVEWASESKQAQSAPAPEQTAQISKQPDRLELSSEALALNAKAQNGGIIAVNDSPGLKEIKNNISSGFYDSPQVLRSVARKINDEMPQLD